MKNFIFDYVFIYLLFVRSNWIFCWSGGAVLLKLLTIHHVDHDVSKPIFLPNVVYFDVHKTK